MPLVFTGKLAPGGLNDSAFEAYDGDRRVFVAITKDAETDFGLARAQEVARVKYANKQLEKDGRVTVTTTDFS